MGREPACRLQCRVHLAGGDLRLAQPGAKHRLHADQRAHATKQVGRPDCIATLEGQESVGEVDEVEYGAVGWRTSSTGFGDQGRRHLELAAHR